MKHPKIGIRPTIDGRQGGVRESLEEKTMAHLYSVLSLTARSAVSPKAPLAPRNSSVRGSGAQSP